MNSGVPKPKKGDQVSLSLSRKAFPMRTCPWIITAILCILFPVSGQEQKSGEKPPERDKKKFIQRDADESMVLRHGGYDALTSIPPPANFQKHLAKKFTATSSFKVIFSDGFTPEAKAAFQYAVDIWSTLIVSDQIIEIQANWKPLGTNILGSARPTKLVNNQLGRWLPISLSNKLNGFDNDPKTGDIVANFNSSFNDWYFGIDALPPTNKVDLVTVVLHEIGHGLGFFGSATVDVNGKGTLGYGPSTTPYHGTVFDYFGVIGDINPARFDLYMFKTQPSLEIGKLLTGGNLYFNGQRAVAANGQKLPKLYAPGTFEKGSSYSHWDEASFPPGNANSLMTPYLGSSEAIHNPGPVTFGLLRDLGW